jgi:uncharacterized protein (DUF433 family)
MNTTAYEHIVLNEKNIAIIDGTQTKVVEIVQDVLAHGWSPAEIHFQHPHLSLGQIHSALAYYYDHISEFEKEVKERLEKVRQIQNQIGQSALAEKLQAGVLS